ncbi:MAG TPA: hypothetical protein VND92_07580 [Vicinamibacterales bacterium]|nr:hypothetical protein [Vicinamibacterales bacterium]
MLTRALLPRGRATRRLMSAVAFVVAIGLSAPASAVPAFARKYQTSCQTCHIMFPKLNAFGEAFRLRGYRMPGETEAMVKVPQVPLGAPAYKQLWPKAIWPGEIPSAVPLAVIVKFGDVSNSTLNPDGSVTTINNDFQFPQELNVFGAGTLGDHVSFYGEITFAQNPDGSVDTALEHADMGFDSPFGPEDLLHIRVGEFNPNLIDGFSETQISTDAAIDPLFDYNPIGVNGGTGLGADGVTPPPISLPTLVQGIEAYGIMHHHALWVAGIANGAAATAGDGTGRFDGNNAKDVWARFDYKIGGMGFDGYTKKGPSIEPWKDNSLRLGAFVYRGDGNGIDFASTDVLGNPLNIQDSHYLRTGLFVSGFIGNLNVFGVYMHGTDTLRLFQPDASTYFSAITPGYDAWFTQADYLIYPWLQGTFRYETVRPGDRTVPRVRTAVLNASALIRANVKLIVEYSRDLQEGTNHSLDAIVRFGF